MLINSIKPLLLDKYDWWRFRYPRIAADIDRINKKKEGSFFYIYPSKDNFISRIELLVPHETAFGFYIIDDPYNELKIYRFLSYSLTTITRGIKYDYY